MTDFSSLLFRFLVTCAAVIAALAVGWQLWLYYMDSPWTRDGRVVSDVVAVAPDVSGLVSDVLVSDNSEVKKGDVLFHIDHDRFALAVQSADAAVEGTKAALTRADSDLKRYKELTKGVASEQKIDEVLALQQQAAAAHAQALAARDLAKLNLERSDVKASVTGIVTNMTLLPGAYVAAGRGVMALVDQSTIRVEGYFEETKLPRIHIGDPVSVRIMGEKVDLSGRVDSIASAIVDSDRTTGSNLLAGINPTFTWVRLAQRVPVRVRLDTLPDGIRLVSGRTATVVINPGQRPRSP